MESGEKQTPKYLGWFSAALLETGSEKDKVWHVPHHVPTKLSAHLEKSKSNPNVSCLKYICDHNDCGLESNSY